MNNYKVTLESLEWINADKGTRYKLYKNNEIQVRLIEFAAGLQHPQWCLTGHTAYVIDGRLEIRFASHSEIYEPGDALIIPEGEEHKHIPKPLTPLVRLFSVERSR